MSDGFDPSIRVIAAPTTSRGRSSPPRRTTPTRRAREVVVFRSEDRRYSFGLWKRVPETGPMELPYHEIAVIIEGEVDVTEPVGTVHRAGPGDVLITPKGSKATWKALSPVKKFWAIYKE